MTAEEFDGYYTYGILCDFLSTEDWTDEVLTLTILLNNGTKIKHTDDWIIRTDSDDNYAGLEAASGLYIPISSILAFISIEVVQHPSVPAKSEKLNTTFISTI